MRIVLAVTAGPLAGQSFTFEGHDVFVVGRAPSCHCRLPENDPYFSRVHFLIEVNPPRCRLMDMDSRNGTFVNNRRVQTFDLQDGDEIKAGHTRLLVKLAKPADGPPAPRGDALVGETLFDIGHDGPPAISLPQPAAVATAAPEKTIVNPAPPPVITDPAALVDTTPGEFTALPRLPGFRLTRELGRGTMGIVYHGVRESDGAEVAIKTILPTEVDNAVTTQRFLREAQVLGQLDHPNVIRFFSAGTAGRMLYFVTEYVNGTDVASVLRERPRVEPKAAVRLAIQVLDALAHAHARGLVHRDIKPANVLLAELPGGMRQVKLADFGLARVYRASQLSGLTINGDLGGTPAYMPPEQITSYREVMPAADQYSTSAMLYHMLTGKWVFDLPPLPAGLMTILTKDPVPLRSRRPELSEGLEQVIHKALAKKPHDRYPDVVAFRQALVPYGR